MIVATCSNISMAVKHHVSTVALSTRDSKPGNILANVLFHFLLTYTVTEYKYTPLLMIIVSLDIRSFE